MSSLSTKLSDIVSVCEVLHREHTLDDVDFSVVMSVSSGIFTWLETFVVMNLDSRHT